MSVYLYTTCSVLTVGCPVYTNDSLTTPAGNGQYYDGATCWTISGGIITGTGACTTTSTTTTTTTVFSCAQCKTWQYSSIPSGGDIVYYYSCIDGTLQSIGLSDTDPNGTFCNCNSVGNPFTSVSPGGTTLTELGTCDPFATTTTSTTTTTTTPPPTTSTTTTTTTTTTANVFVQNASLDVPITDVTVNGTSVTHTGGANFPVNAGENGNFQTSQLGTQNVIIYYGGHTSGQNLTFTDSNSNLDCQNLNGGAGSFTITGATITGGTDVYVNVADGACS